MSEPTAEEIAEAVEEARRNRTPLSLLTEAQYHRVLVHEQVVAQRRRAEAAKARLNRRWSWAEFERR